MPALCTFHGVGLRLEVVASCVSKVAPTCCFLGRKLWCLFVAARRGIKDPRYVLAERSPVGRLLQASATGRSVDAGGHEFFVHPLIIIVQTCQRMGGYRDTVILRSNMFVKSYLYPFGQTRESMSQLISGSKLNINMCTGVSPQHTAPGRLTCARHCSVQPNGPSRFEHTPKNKGMATKTPKL